MFYIHKLVNIGGHVKSLETHPSEYLRSILTGSHSLWLDDTNDREIMLASELEC